MINLTSIFDEIYSYAQTLESTWLFPSRKGNQPISKIQAYRQLQKAGDFADVESIGTHTMRKIFGYWFYKQTKDIAMLQDILNHSTPKITLKYIGINKKEKDNVLDIFYIQEDNLLIINFMTHYTTIIQSENFISNII